MTDRLNAYLITRYLYHWRCMSCGTVTHRRAGAAPDDCEQCGRCCWQTLGSSPGRGPWYVQSLDTDCPTCRKTLSEVASIEAQLVLL